MTANDIHEIFKEQLDMWGGDVDIALANCGLVLMPQADLWTCPDCGLRVHLATWEGPGCPSCEF